MSLERGEVVTETLPAGWSTPELRHDLGFAVVDGLAGLHGIDWQATGVPGRPEEPTSGSETGSPDSWPTRPACRRPPSPTSTRG
ncbi:hypothetical protein GCM10025867_25990 [Frondihabitans sucicola]|uniref:Aminoglycoside phosphotransferase domain-containing protein n=1 Tax=Frondihabitans sucicola TaxID=1268041 RepID=A0ABM8GPL0_9MICO|nr:hypothetical protein GCM10025867_25990 [Frondihabitans sucicola]